MTVVPPTADVKEKVNFGRGWFFTKHRASQPFNVFGFKWSELSTIKDVIFCNANKDCKEQSKVLSDVETPFIHRRGCKKAAVLQKQAFFHLSEVKVDF